MKSFRLITLNLLQDEWLREERLILVATEIKRLKPDVLMLQEVDFTGGVHQIIHKSLPGYYLNICRKGGRHADFGSAIFSRFKSIEDKRLELGQNRVAQRVTLKIRGARLNFVNVHLYFNPFSDKARRTQVKKVLDFAGHPSLIAGDFNALPRYGSIKTMNQRFSSAYKEVHGREPKRTYPTPLRMDNGLRNSLRRRSLRALGLATSTPKQNWGGAIDYIFVEKGFRVAACEVVFDKPSAKNEQIYASDHFGLLADLAYED